MNKSHDYRALEREFVTSQISLRELCRRHGITAAHLNHIAGHELFRSDDLRLPVTHDPRRGRSEPAQRLERALGAMLLQ